MASRQDAGCTATSVEETSRQSSAPGRGSYGPAAEVGGPSQDSSSLECTRRGCRRSIRLGRALEARRSQSFWEELGVQQASAMTQVTSAFQRTPSVAVMGADSHPLGGTARTRTAGGDWAWVELWGDGERGSHMSPGKSRQDPPVGGAWASRGRKELRMALLAHMVGGWGISGTEVVKLHLASCVGQVRRS